MNENYGVACQGIIQVVPYYSIFQQLVICLISVLEPNGMIIKNKTDGQREKGPVWSFLNETTTMKPLFFLICAV